MPSSDSAPEDVQPSSDDLKENAAGDGGDGAVEDQLPLTPNGCQVVPLTPDGRQEEMDTRSWTYRSKSLDGSPGETESSGSASCSSEKNSVDQDQEGSKASTNNTHSPENPSTPCKDNDAIKCLTEKLSAALSTIRNNEELVNQHAKVAEEAVSGWEKAEIEVVHLKQQLDTVAQKNVSLEDRIIQLDEALKECVRELRQAKGEQEQKVHGAVLKKSQEWETEKFELESQIIELESQLQAERDASTSLNYNLKSKLEAVEQENSGLRIELFTLSDKYRILHRESELSTQAAESASKQHLDSITKVAKLEAENRRLRVLSRKPHNDQKPFGSNIYVESVTDSQSDSGERMLSVDNDPSCSDSWASALIAELDQFKNEKTSGRDVTSSIEVDLMDDFLEMERLASIPVTTARNSTADLQPGPDQNSAENKFLQAELERLHHRIADLEEKVEKVESEKAELAVLLSVTQEKLEISSLELREAESKLVELQKQLDAARASKQVSDIAVEAGDAERAVLQSQLGTANAEVQRLRDQMPVLQSQLEVAAAEVQQLHDQVPVLESQLGTANAEVQQLQDQVLGLQSQLTSANSRVQHLQDQVRTLEGYVEKERILAEEYSVKCEKLETELLKRKHRAEVHQASRSNGDFKMKQEKELALAAGKLAECQQTIASLGRQLKSLANIEDLILEGEYIENGSTLSVSVVGEPTRFAPYNSREAISSLSNGRERGSVTSSTSSSGFPIPYLPQQ